jgi:hypothetical protein
MPRYVLATLYGLLWISTDSALFLLEDAHVLRSLIYMNIS